MENYITISSHEEFIEHTAINNESDNNKQNICYISHPDSKLIIDYEIGYNFVLYLENKNVEVVNFSSCTFNFPLAINKNLLIK